MKRIVIAALLVAFVPFAAFSTDFSQTIDFEILKSSGNNINYYFRYRLLSDSSASVDLAHNDEIVIGNFQTRQGVKAGSVFFDLMDGSLITEAGNYIISLQK